VGDYLFRYHAISGNFPDSAAIPGLTLVGIAQYLAHRLSQVLRETLLTPYFASMPAAALAACAYAIIRRARRFLFPGLWFCWLLLIFSFGSASPRVYQPSALAWRQYPILLPAVLLVSGLASSLLSSREPNAADRQRRRRLLWGVLLSVYLAGVSLVIVGWGISKGMGWPCRVEREMSRILKPTDPLYTDPHTAIALEFFWKFPATDSTHDFKGMSIAQLPPRAYVLLNRNRLDAVLRINKNPRYVPPEFRDSIPPTWQKLRDKDNATLYWVPPLPPPN
jgi:hypothetical protein